MQHVCLQKQMWAMGGPFKRVFFSVNGADRGKLIPLALTTEDGWAVSSCISDVWSLASPGILELPVCPAPPFLLHSHSLCHKPARFSSHISHPGYTALGKRNH